jgi:hypothetical protein
MLPSSSLNTRRGEFLKKNSTLVKLNKPEKKPPRCNLVQLEKKMQRQQDDVMTDDDLNEAVEHVGLEEQREAAMEAQSARMAGTLDNRRSVVLSHRKNVHPLEWYGPIREEHFVSDYFDSSILTKDGIMFNYHNTNCTDSATILGSTRIMLKDCRKIIWFITKNEQLLKQKAVQQLMFHLNKTQLSYGAGEKLSIDDFSISYMLGSPSDEAKLAHPNRRNEVPLTWTALPNMVREITWFTKPDGTPSASALVNVYIHILEPSKRKGAVAKREEEQRRQAEFNAAQPPMKRQYNGPGGPRNKYQPPQPPAPAPEIYQVQTEVAVLKERFNHMAQANSYPAMPTEGKIWVSASQQKDLPNELGI